MDAWPWKIDECRDAPRCLVAICLCPPLTSIVSSKYGDTGVRTGHDVFADWNVQWWGEEVDHSLSYWIDYGIPSTGDAFKADGYVLSFNKY